MPGPAVIPQEKRAASRHWRRARFIPLGFGALAMALGFWTGLLRLGFPLSIGTFPSSDLHAALLICAFLGTVISLERAVALGAGWAHAAPVLSAAGAAALFVDAPATGAFAFIGASVVLLIVTIRLTLRQLALFNAVLATAAACWSVGTIAWLTGQAMPAVAGWWLDFLILTIAAERLELSRILSVTRLQQILFLTCVVALLIGTARNELIEAWAPFSALGLLGLALWLLRRDAARRIVRQSGQPRFSASAILAGHAWLATAGILLAIAPSGAVMLTYDAAVHAITIGFVLSMIFGHVPIILPAVTGLRVRFSGALYGPLALLHVSVATRVLGDILGWPDTRAMSALLTILALAGYALTVVVVSRRFRQPLT